MTLPARTWLPANALADASVQTLVRDCAATWIKRWLPDPRDILASTHKLSPPTKIPSAFRCWTNQTRTLALAIDETSAAKLATQMIGAPAGGKLNAADLGLYRQLVESCLSDLMQALASLFACDSAIHEAKHHEVGAQTKYVLSCVSGGPAFDIYVDNALIMEARRSAAKGGRPGVPLGAMGEAIGRQQIRLGAAIGAATIALSELYNLARGDVIVLDRPLDDGVFLTINNRVVADASALIQRSETGLELHMTQMGPEQA